MKKEQKIRLANLKGKQESLVFEVEKINALYDAKRAQLQENDTFNQLNSLEAKLRSIESQTFGMRDCKLFEEKVLLIFM